jgi:hypothetical protein
MEMEGLLTEPLDEELREDCLEGSCFTLLVELLPSVLSFGLQ